MPKLEFRLTKDKTTKGAVRYAAEDNDRPINIYLSKERASELGDPEKVKLTIEPA